MVDGACRTNVCEKHSYGLINLSDSPVAQKGHSIDGRHDSEAPKCHSAVIEDRPDGGSPDRPSITSSPPFNADLCSAGQRPCNPKPAATRSAILAS